MAAKSSNNRVITKTNTTPSKTNLSSSSLSPFRPLRVVIRNLHPSTFTKDIITSLLEIRTPGYPCA